MVSCKPPALGFRAVLQQKALELLGVVAKAPRGNEELPTLHLAFRTRREGEGLGGWLTKGLGGEL